MQKRQPYFPKNGWRNKYIFAADLSHLADNWFMAGEINRYSDHTTQARRDLLKKLSWFLSHKFL